MASDLDGAAAAHSSAADDTVSATSGDDETASGEKFMVQQTSDVFVKGSDATLFSSLKGRVSNQTLQAIDVCLLA